MNFDIHPISIFFYRRALLWNLVVELCCGTLLWNLVVENLLLSRLKIATPKNKTRVLSSLTVLWRIPNELPPDKQHGTNWFSTVFSAS